MKRLPVLALTAFLLAACAHQQPIYNVSAHPMPASAQKMSLAEIEKIIIDAGQTRGWKFQPISAGKLKGIQDQPKYGAEVDIVFDQKTYSISHARSRGMKEQGGVIHSHYNNWIHYLEGDIDTWVTNAGAKAK